MTPKQEVFRVVDMYTSGIYIQLADTRILPWFIPVRNEGSGTFSTKRVEGEEFQEVQDAHPPKNKMPQTKQNKK